MKLNEVSALLALRAEFYPRDNDKATERTVKAWQIVLEDITYNEAQAALVAYSRQDKPFAPTPGNLYAMVQMLRGEDPAGDELKAWEKVRRAVIYASPYPESRMIHGERVKKGQSEWAYEALPEDVQAVIGDPRTLLRWADVDSDEFETVIQSQFLRAYREQRQRRRTIEKLPEKMRAALEDRPPIARLEGIHG